MDPQLRKEVIKVLEDIVKWYGMREGFPDKLTTDALLPKDQQPPEMQCVIEVLDKLKGDV